ncbi:MAG: phage tail protein [Pacificimonas sp.]
MATVILTAVGSAVGGPVGSAIGATVGSVIDAKLFAPKGREGPRLADLSVQGSDYGTSLARHYGVVRSAGTVIWSSGLTETARRSGGGKKSGGRTTTYSYSANFAVAFAARRVERVGRIWADGKLLCGAAGDMQAGGAVRIYTGSARQKADPLLEAELGVEGAPAHRGLAYAVFEGLELADFANRIPNLSFEIFADAGGTEVGAVLADLALASGGVAEVSGLTRTITGFSASRNSALAAHVAALDVAAPLVVRPGVEGLSFAARGAGDVVAVSEADLLPLEAGTAGSGETARAGYDELPGSVTLVANDPARDHQPSVQRALRAQALHGGSAHIDLPASLTAGEAKRMAEGYLAELWARRGEASRRLRLSSLLLVPGDVVRLGAAAGSGGDWHVRRTEISGLGVDVALERRRGGPPIAPEADSGLAELPVDIPQGATVLRVAELPPIEGEGETEARVWLAAGGASAGWRRAELWTSVDAGASWASVGVVSTAAKMGVVAGALPSADWTRWDERNAVIVNLLDSQALESRTRDAVLAGANLALVGGELVQFARAEQLDARRWRLSGLLRGRRGTEAAVAGHVAGEDFLLLEPEALFPLDVPLARVGAEMLLKAVGPADGVAVMEAVATTVTGRSLRPLSPVLGRAWVDADGAVRARWTRRSRFGFGWTDATDAPLGEEREIYAVTLAVGAEILDMTVAAAELRLEVTAQVAAFGGPVTGGTLTVRQVSARVGAGDALKMIF